MVAANASNAVHLPFGIGPRNCIGMRFALLEAKIALIELLKRFNFVKAPETEVCTTQFHTRIIIKDSACIVLLNTPFTCLFSIPL